MILARPVNPRASRSAHIVASVPDDTQADHLHRRHRGAQLGEPTSISVGAPNVVPDAPLDRIEDVGMGVAEDQWTPRSDESR